MSRSSSIVLWVTTLHRSGRDSPVVYDAERGRNGTAAIASFQRGYGGQKCLTQVFEFLVKMALIYNEGNFKEFSAVGAKF